MIKSKIIILIVIVLVATVGWAGFVPIGSQQFNDSLFRIFDNADASKKAAFEVSGITTGTTRTYTFPNLSGTLLCNIVEDTTPQLGGNLDGQTYNITNLGTVNGLGIATSASHIEFDLPTAYSLVFDSSPVSWNLTNEVVGGIVLTVSGDSALNQNLRIADSPTHVKMTLSGNTLNIATSKTPAGPSAAGTAGDIAWDADFLYVAVATNTWKRTAIATWGIPAEDVIYAAEDVIYAAEQVVYP